MRPPQLSCRGLLAAVYWFPVSLVLGKFLKTHGVGHGCLVSGVDWGRVDDHLHALPLGAVLDGCERSSVSHWEECGHGQAPALVCLRALRGRE
jgi:hypothetical protein